MAKLKEANLVLEEHLRELGIGFVREFQFYEKRKWRFDYITGPILGDITGTGRMSINQHHPTDSFAIEIEGAVWTQGRHTRGSGYLKDLEKYRVAAALNYKVYRFSTQEVLDGTAKKFLQQWTA